MIEPALSAEEWKAFPDPRTLGNVDLPGTIARCNAMLPDADPRKITWAMVDVLRDEAVGIGSGGLAGREDTPYRTQRQREEALQRIADALASYLPPRLGLMGAKVK